MHGSEGTERCTCGAPVLRGSHFCPNCGRVLGGDVDPGTRVISQDTVVAPPPADDDADGGAGGPTPASSRSPRRTGPARGAAPGANQTSPTASNAASGSR